MVIEAVVDSLSHVLLAQEYGANRIELCAHLVAGGITPSIGLILVCVDQLTIPTFVLIGCRPGSFQYFRSEIYLMCLDIANEGRVGAAGVVFGCLTQDYEIDVSATRLFISCACEFGLATTFHRAIDFTPSLVNAARLLSELNIDNVLTAGGMPTAIKGSKAINQMIIKRNNKIKIIAGGGIHHSHILPLRQLDVSAFHFSVMQKSKHMSQASSIYGKNVEFHHEKVIKLINTISSLENQ